MASIAQRLIDLEYLVYQPQIEAKTYYPQPLNVKVDVTITLELNPIRHYCSADKYVELHDSDRIFFEETRRFNLSCLKNRYGAYRNLAPMLRRMGINPYDENDWVKGCIGAIVQFGLRIAKWPTNKGRRVLPLRVDIKGARVEDVNNGEGESEEEDALIAAKEEEALIAAKEEDHSLRVEDKEEEEEEDNKCPICLEGLTMCGLETNFQMPCSHSFHKDCIRRWQARNRFCPLCRAQTVPIKDEFIDLFKSV